MIGQKVNGARSKLVLAGALLSLLLPIQSVTATASEPEETGGLHYQCVPGVVQPEDLPPMPKSLDPQSADPLPPKPPPVCPDGQLPQPVAQQAPKALPPGPPGSHAPTRSFGYGFWYSWSYGHEDHTGGHVLGTHIEGTIERPWVNPYSRDTHSLGQIWMSDNHSPGPSTVEFGWHVSRNLWRDSLPHLFVYHFDCGNPTGYGLGWVNVSANYYYGMSLPHTNGIFNRWLAYEYRYPEGRRWYIALNGEWVGYFPEIAWTCRYPRIDRVQMGGEVASPEHDTCSDMGRQERYGTHPGAAGWARSQWWDYGGGAHWANHYAGNSDPAYYNTGNYFRDDTGLPSNANRFTTFRYGGPGWCGRPPGT